MEIFRQLMYVIRPMRVSISCLPPCMHGVVYPLAHPRCTLRSLPTPPPSRAPRAFPSLSPFYPAQPTKRPREEPLPGSENAPLFGALDEELDAPLTLAPGAPVAPHGTAPPAYMPNRGGRGGCGGRGSRGGRGKRGGVGGGGGGGAPAACEGGGKAGKETGFGEGYCRKEKSLGLLCDNFLRFCRGQRDGVVSLDAAAVALGVERRRIYDVTNILEALDIVSRRTKNQYTWHGTAHLATTLKRLRDSALGDAGRRGEAVPTAALEAAPGDPAHWFFGTLARCASPAELASLRAIAASAGVGGGGAPAGALSLRVEAGMFPGFATEAGAPTLGLPAAPVAPPPPPPPAAPCVVDAAPAGVGAAPAAAAPPLPPPPPPLPSASAPVPPTATQRRASHLPPSHPDGRQLPPALTVSMALSAVTFPHSPLVNYLSVPPAWLEPIGVVAAGAGGKKAAAATAAAAAAAAVAAGAGAAAVAPPPPPPGAPAIPEPVVRACPASGRPACSVSVSVSAAAASLACAPVCFSLRPQPPLPSALAPLALPLGASWTVDITDVECGLEEEVLPFKLRSLPLLSEVLFAWDASAGGTAGCFFGATSGAGGGGGCDKRPRRDRSLGVLTQRFLKVFLLDRKVVTLDFATPFVIPDDEDDEEGEEDDGLEDFRREGVLGGGGGSWEGGALVALGGAGVEGGARARSGGGGGRGGRGRGRGGGRGARGARGGGRASLSAPLPLPAFALDDDGECPLAASDPSMESMAALEAAHK
jgi:hypothetical protein